MRFVVVLLLGFSLILSACQTTRTSVSSSLPYGVQQQINTSSEYNVAFDFSPNMRGDLVTAKFGGAKAQYEVNDPMRGMLTELIQTKFGAISSESNNKIAVEIVDISTSSDRMTHELGMTVEVTTVHDGETNSREISYSTVVEAEDRGGEYTIAYSIPKQALEDFYVKFVVAVDKFVDANFGFQS